MTIHFGNPNLPQTVAEAVPLYGIREFQSPTRSTIPMLSLLIHAPKRFAEFVRLVEMSESHDLHLEYTVRSPKGRGKASHTDVMLRTGTESLAVEAKWTEPLDKPIRTWREAGPDRSNRVAVLEGWLDYLREQTTTPLNAADFDAVPYQMLHRAASAASAGKSARLAYVLFQPSPSKQTARPDLVFDMLGALWDKLGRPEKFPFFVVEIEAKPLTAYRSLQGLPKSEDQTSEAVSAALQDVKQPLFDFRIAQCRKVGSGIVTLPPSSAPTGGIHT
jgi:hypothetical protein